MKFGYLVQSTLVGLLMCLVNAGLLAGDGSSSKQGSGSVTSDGNAGVGVAGEGGVRLVQLEPASGARLKVIDAGAGPASEVWVPELDLSEGSVVGFHSAEAGFMVLLVRMSDERRPKVGCHYKIVRVARREDDKEKWSVKKVHLLKLPGVEVEGRFIGRDGRRIRFGRPVDARNMKDGAPMFWTDVVFLEAGEVRLVGAYPIRDQLIEQEDFFPAGARGGVYGSSLQYVQGRPDWPRQERAAEAGFMIREEVSKVVGEGFEAVLLRPSKEVLAVEISPGPGSKVPNLKISFEGHGIDGYADNCCLIDVKAGDDEVRLLFLGDESYVAVRVSRRDGEWKVEDEILKVGCGKMQGLEGSDYDLLNVGFSDDGGVEFVGYHKEKGTGSVKFESVFVKGGDLRPKVVGDGEYWSSRFSARAGRLSSRAVAE